MNNGDHELEKLDELLTCHYRSLLETVPQQREAILDRYAEHRAAASPLSRSQWRTPAAWLASAAGLAAIVVGVALLVSSSERTVYGIEAVPRRLAEVKTIRQRGHHFVHDDRHPERAPMRVPFEYIVERPGKFRMTTYGVSYGLHDPPLLRTFTRICDGSKETWIADQDKKVTTTELTEMDAWLTTEFFAQMFLEELFGPPELSYQLIGHDTVRGKKCDIYEGRSIDGRPGADSKEPQQVVRIWVDPTHGYPLRSESEEVDADGTIRRLKEFDEIAIDVPIDAATFRVAVPAGFKQVNTTRPANAPPLDVHYTSAGFGGDDDKLEIWHAFRISDHAALVVWRRSEPLPDTNGVRDWLASVSFGMSGEGQHDLAHAWVYESRSPDVWNWSLLHVEDGSLPERGGLTVDLYLEKLHAHCGVTPLRFPVARLAPLIEAAAESTLPADAPRVSLQQLRQLVEAD